MGGVVTFGFYSKSEEDILSSFFNSHRPVPDVIPFAHKYVYTVDENQIFHRSLEALPFKGFLIGIFRSFTPISSSSFLGDYFPIFI
jgi:hypothetical protein